MQGCLYKPTFTLKNNSKHTLAVFGYKINYDKSEMLHAWCFEKKKTHIGKGTPSLKLIHTDVTEKDKVLLKVYFTV